MAGGRLLSVTERMGTLESAGGRLAVPVGVLSGRVAGCNGSLVMLRRRILVSVLEVCLAGRIVILELIWVQ